MCPERDLLELFSGCNKIIYYFCNRSLSFIDLNIMLEIGKACESNWNENGYDEWSQNFLCYDLSMYVEVCGNVH